ncbi:MAG: DNA repair protein RecN (Recombination protein N) [Nitrospirae bacterium]|nr:MAG: DNA repair protein RecN (Recombination protein N) [Nitrospirota bacterium]
MLTELRIRNFTILDEISVRFSGGLTVLSGETGAGKSIIVDAIALLLGEKASHEMIRSGASEAQISGFFSAEPLAALDELGIAGQDELSFRRSVPLQGKSRAFINDTAVSLPTLSRIGRELVSIHGQHEQQDLLRSDLHLPFLDEFGDLLDDAAAVKQRYEEIAALRSELGHMQVRMRERAHRIELLRFQMNEIDAAAVLPGEKEAIEEERLVLMHAVRLQESSALAYELLYDTEGSCLDRLSTVQAKAAEMAEFDANAQELVELLQSAQPLLKDASLLVRRLRDGYESDPDRLNELEERLEQIKKLEKKYGLGFDALHSFRAAAEEELCSLEQIEEQVSAGEETIARLTTELLERAAALSTKRSAAARTMENMLQPELKQLGFQKARFSVAIRRTEHVTQDGLDDAEFLFSANPGEPPKPLGKVASGGELSRIMLALKSTALSGGKGAQKQHLRSTLIFDEVDAGIGGATAQHVGNRLKALSKTYQVFCITHLPQIAAIADTHIKVDKEVSADSVRVHIAELAGSSREEELARMLSGRITEVSLQHARELLHEQKVSLKEQ